MKIIEYSQTVRTTDVIHVYDDDKKLHWFIAFDKTNGKWEGGRELMNYENFKQQGANYMQKVYDIAYKKVDELADEKSTPPPLPVAKQSDGKEADYQKEIIERTTLKIQQKNIELENRIWGTDKAPSPLVNNKEFPHYDELEEKMKTLLKEQPTLWDFDDVYMLFHPFLSVEVVNTEREKHF